MNTNKIDLIKAEVERLKLYTMDEHMKFYSECAEAEYNALCKVEEIIDSLQEELVSNDLEEAALLHLSKNYDTNVIWDEDKKCVVRDFKAGAQWQKQKDSIVREDLEEASKEWLRPQLDKSYANYGEAKMMELTHFDGYAMLDAIEFGAKWAERKNQKK